MRDDLEGDPLDGAFLQLAGLVAAFARELVAIVAIVKADLHARALAALEGECDKPVKAAAKTAKRTRSRRATSRTTGRRAASNRSGQRSSAARASRGTTTIASDVEAAGSRVARSASRTSSSGASATVASVPPVGRRERKCSRCGVSGHNARTCATGTVDVAAEQQRLARTDPVDERNTVPADTGASRRAAIAASKGSIVEPGPSRRDSAPLPSREPSPAERARRAAIAETLRQSQLGATANPPPESTPSDERPLPSTDAGLYATWLLHKDRDRANAAGREMTKRAKARTPT